MDFNHLFIEESLSFWVAQMTSLHRRKPAYLIASLEI
jgi:hypothetical protein